MMNERDKDQIYHKGWASKSGHTFSDWFDVAWNPLMELYRVMTVFQLQILSTFVRCHSFATSA
jgi:hypothetical protein